MKLRLFIFSLVCVLSANAQINTTIEEITKKPKNFLEEKVVVEGVVTQFTPETSTSNAHFLLEGKYGKIIMVKTDESEPIQKRRYKVVGTVYIENKRPFIHERSKVCLDCEIHDGENSDDHIKDHINDPVPESWMSSKKNKLLVGIGVAFIALVLILIYLMKKGKKPSDSDGNGKPETDKASNVEPTSAPTDEFKTIKINLNKDPKTMRFIPGRLDIVAGADAGKSFRIAGYPTQNGNLVTIGRATVSGDGAYAHIKLEQKTISRKQAEIRERDGKIYLKNLTDVNKTQVDGVELEVNEEMEIFSGQTIRMGELELKYSI
jgi:FHA domain-containing protein